MIVIGLTGGIGMGKTTLALQLASMGAKICSADAIVHRLFLRNDIQYKIEERFPGTVKQGRVDRPKLGEIIFHDARKRHALEQLLHPLVIAEEEYFVGRQRSLGASIVVLDIPLLFETGGQTRCDVTLLATAPFFIQKQRVMQRPNMTEEKFAAIVAAQMPDLEKQQRADIIVPTGMGKAYSYRLLAGYFKGD